MKTSDISDRDVLEILYKTQGEWASHCWGELAEYFKKFPDKLGLSKMRSLLKRKLVTGCPCGCRGDWEITNKGLAFLEKPRLKPFTGS